MSRASEREIDTVARKQGRHKAEPSDPSWSGMVYEIQRNLLLQPSFPASQRSTLALRLRFDGPLADVARSINVLTYLISFT